MSREFLRSGARVFMKSQNRDRFSPSNLIEGWLQLSTFRYCFTPFVFPGINSLIYPSDFRLNGKRYRRMTISGSEVFPAFPSANRSKIQTIDWVDDDFRTGSPPFPNPVISTVSQTGSWSTPLTIFNNASVTELEGHRIVYSASNQHCEIVLSNEAEQLADIEHVYSILGGLTLLENPTPKPNPTYHQDDRYSAQGDSAVFDGQFWSVPPIPSARLIYQRGSSGTFSNTGGVTPPLTRQNINITVSKIFRDVPTSHAWITFLNNTVTPTLAPVEIYCQEEAIFSGNMNPPQIELVEDGHIEGFGVWEKFYFPPNVQPDSPYPLASCVP